MCLTVINLIFYHIHLTLSSAAVVTVIIAYAMISDNPTSYIAYHYGSTIIAKVEDL